MRVVRKYTGIIGAHNADGVDMAYWILVHHVISPPPPNTPNLFTLILTPYATSTNPIITPTIDERCS